jgi:hypothetical protein
MIGTLRRPTRNSACRTKIGISRFLAHVSTKAIPTFGVGGEAKADNPDIAENLELQRSQRMKPLR